MSELQIIIKSPDPAVGYLESDTTFFITADRPILREDVERIEVPAPVRVEVVSEGEIVGWFDLVKEKDGTHSIKTGGSIFTALKW